MGAHVRMFMRQDATESVARESRNAARMNLILRNCFICVCLAFIAVPSGKLLKLINPSAEKAKSPMKKALNAERVPVATQSDDTQLVAATDDDQVVGSAPDYEIHYPDDVALKINTPPPKA
jgi:hypothetical protein